MGVQNLTLFHVFISLVGIASGFGVMAGLIAGQHLPRWTAVFLVTTIITSVTGFFFPFNGITPGIVVGIISLIALAVACYALYVHRLGGRWRIAYVVTAVMALYFNVFVLVVQLFQKVPALAELAPHQNEPPFAVTQAIVLIIFVTLGITAVKKYRIELRQPT
jgi:hypothetical protein